MRLRHAKKRGQLLRKQFTVHWGGGIKVEYSIAKEGVERAVQGGYRREGVVR